MSIGFIKKVILWSGLFASSTLFAGVRDIGNGGAGVYCQATTNSPERLQLLDIYEGQILLGISPIESSVPYEKQAMSHAAYLDNLIDNKDSYFEERITHIMSMLRFLPVGVGLGNTNDLNNIIYPKNCQIVQVLNYTDQDVIYVDSDLWAKFSETEKTAAILHEVVYEYFRAENSFIVGDRDSIRTRRVIAFLLGGRNLKKVDESLPTDKKLMHCETNAYRESGKPLTSLTLYQRADSGLTYVQFQSINGRRLLSQAAFDVNIDSPKSVLIAQITSSIDGDITVKIENFFQDSFADEKIEIRQGSELSSSVMECWPPESP